MLWLVCFPYTSSASHSTDTSGEGHSHGDARTWGAGPPPKSPRDFLWAASMRPLVL